MVSSKIITLFSRDELMKDAKESSEQIQGAPLVTMGFSSFGHEPSFAMDLGVPHFKTHKTTDESLKPTGSLSPANSKGKFF